MALTRLGINFNNVSKVERQVRTSSGASTTYSWKELNSIKLTNGTIIWEKPTTYAYSWKKYNIITTTKKTVSRGSIETLHLKYSITNDFYDVATPYGDDNISLSGNTWSGRYEDWTSAQPPYTLVHSGDASSSVGGSYSGFYEFISSTENTGDDQIIRAYPLIVSTQSVSSRGEYTGMTVHSNSSSAYPTNGVYGGYWYVKIGSGHDTYDVYFKSGTNDSGPYYKGYWEDPVISGNTITITNQPPANLGVDGSCCFWCLNIDTNLVSNVLLSINQNTEQNYDYVLYGSLGDTGMTVNNTADSGYSNTKGNASSVTTNRNYSDLAQNGLQPLEIKFIKDSSTSVDNESVSVNVRLTKR